MFSKYTKISCLLLFVSCLLFSSFGAYIPSLTGGSGVTNLAAAYGTLPSPTNLPINFQLAPTNVVARFTNGSSGSFTLQNNVSTLVVDGMNFVTNNQGGFVLTNLNGTSEILAANKSVLLVAPYFTTLNGPGDGQTSQITLDTNLVDLSAGNTGQGQLIVYTNKVVSSVPFYGDGSGLTNLPITALNTNAGNVGQVLTISSTSTTAWSNAAAGGGSLPGAVTNNQSGVNLPNLTSTNAVFYDKQDDIYSAAAYFYGAMNNINSGTIEIYGTGTNGNPIIDFYSTNGTMRAQIGLWSKYFGNGFSNKLSVELQQTPNPGNTNAGPDFTVASENKDEIDSGIIRHELMAVSPQRHAFVLWRARTDSNTYTNISDSAFHVDLSELGSQGVQGLISRSRNYYAGRGTIAVSGSTMTGTGTFFTDDIQVGDILTGSDGSAIFVDTISSPTSAQVRDWTNLAKTMTVAAGTTYNILENAVSGQFFKNQNIASTLQPGNIVIRASVPKVLMTDGTTMLQMQLGGAWFTIGFWANSAPSMNPFYINVNAPENDLQINSGGDISAHRGLTVGDVSGGLSNFGVLTQYGAHQQLGALNVGGVATFTNTISAPTNTASYFITSATGNYTNGVARGIWSCFITFNDAVTGAPAAQVKLQGIITNFITPVFIGTAGSVTNYYSFPVQPNSTNSITDVSTGAGASITVKSVGVN